MFFLVGNWLKSLQLLQIVGVEQLCVQTYHTVFCGTPSCVDILVVLVSGLTEMTTRILPSPEVLTLFVVVHSHVAAH